MLSNELKKIAREVFTDDKTLEHYQKDASLFEVRPEAVVFPKNTEEIKAVVRFVGQVKASTPECSITARGAGTDMSGGPLNRSIILDMTKHINRLGEVSDDEATAEPGLFYRDFEKETLKRGKLMPAYTASKELCTVGGMVANNSGGEKSIRYGKVANFIKRQKIIFSDGNEYVVTPLNREQLKLKMEQNDFEGYIYKKLFKLVEKNGGLIEGQKPRVSKNSAGYALWDVWREAEGVFDLNKLIAGSQGTLGITTEVTFGLVDAPKHSRMVVVFMNKLDRLGELVDAVMPFEPESFESYDDVSLKLAVRFSFNFFKALGFWKAFKLGLEFIPDAFLMATGGIPKLILMIEVTGDDDSGTLKRCQTIAETLKSFGHRMRITRTKTEAEKYWKIRRESFNLLRKHIQGKRTAPFIDDVIVRPHDLPQFLPELESILKRYDLTYTIAGHAGNGNFHIIPLMDLNKPFSAEIILKLSNQIYELVKRYRGSTTAEHNDGIIRTPFLGYVFSEEMLALFSEVKHIFDPQDIFNPGKKVGGTVEDIKKYLAKGGAGAPHAS